MSLRWIGAILIFTGCGGVGLFMILQDKRQLETVKELTDALVFMRNELSCRVTPLPALCVMASSACKGEIAAVLKAFSTELEGQALWDVSLCMRAVVTQCRPLPQAVEALLNKLGKSIGKFGLSEQLAGLDALLLECNTLRSDLERDRPQRLRNYQTLALCSGAAMAILLL